MIKRQSAVSTVRQQFGSGQAQELMARVVGWSRSTSLAMANPRPTPVARRALACKSHRTSGMKCTESLSAFRRTAAGGCGGAAAAAAATRRRRRRRPAAAAAAQPRGSRHGRRQARRQSGLCREGGQTAGALM
jgi:hypothetical protein